MHTETSCSRSARRAKIPRVAASTSNNRSGPSLQRYTRITALEWRQQQLTEPQLAAVFPLRPPWRFSVIIYNPSLSLMAPRNNPLPGPSSRASLHSIRRSRGSPGRAPVRPARTRILRRPQYAHSHLVPAPAEHIGVLHTLTPARTTDTTILSPNTTNADGTYADVRLPLG